MKLSRLAVLIAVAAAVLAIFDDPFGVASQFIDNPRFALAIFENPFG